MSIPDYQTIMLPLLEYAAAGSEHRFRTAVEQLSAEFRLTAGERKELLPSGRAPLFQNRVGWAKTYLTKAGLLEATRRGYFRITDRGRELLQQPPKRIDRAFLQRYPEFVAFLGRSRRPSKEDVGSTSESTAETPEETLESAYTSLKQNLVGELLDQVQAAS